MKKISNNRTTQNYNLLLYFSPNKNKIKKLILYKIRRRRRRKINSNNKITMNASLIIITFLL